MSDAWTPPVQTPYAQPAPAAPPVPKPSYEPAAITALVLAITGWFVWFVPSIVAIFLGSGAKRNIKASPETRKGSGMATLAQLLSAASLVFAAGIAGLLLLV